LAVAAREELLPFIALEWWIAVGCCRPVLCLKSLALADALGFERFELLPPLEWLELMIVTLLLLEKLEAPPVMLLKTWIGFC
jgi:hypothetical protein